MITSLFITFSFLIIESSDETVPPWCDDRISLPVSQVTAVRYTADTVSHRHRSEQKTIDKDGSMITGPDQLCRGIVLARSSRAFPIFLDYL